jgi:hypothetical protein
MSSSGFGSNSGSDFGAGGATGGTGTGGAGGSMGSGGGNTGLGAGSTGGAGTTGTGTGTETHICPTCGQSTNSGLEQFLSRLGITPDMIGNLKGQFQNVEIDEYMNTARDYLKDGSSKATTYAKDNPGKVAAGVAALALGAGLLYAAVNRDKS